MLFCSLIKGITLKIHMCFVLINSALLNLLDVWILFYNVSTVAVILVSDFCKAVQITYCLDKTLIKILNHFCGLDIEQNNPVALTLDIIIQSSHRTHRFINMSCHQTKSG